MQGSHHAKKKMFSPPLIIKLNTKLKRIEGVGATLCPPKKFVYVVSKNVTWKAERGFYCTRYSVRSGRWNNWTNVPSLRTMRRQHVARYWVEQLPLFPAVRPPHSPSQSHIPPHIYVIICMGCSDRKQRPVHISRLDTLIGVHSIRWTRFTAWRLLFGIGPWK